MKIINKINLTLGSLIDLIYPKHCEICTIDLNTKERFICLGCKYDLPYINQSKQTLETLGKLFWGRVEVENVLALLNYQKGNQTQKILHQLKYHNKKKLATYFGEMIGELVHNPKDIDYLIPVPLHPKKKRIRGFNQSTVIANGVYTTTNIPIIEHAMIRNTFNTSQTKFSKFDRWDNVKRIFTVTKPDLLRNKHIILIDDVLTTGATIEACVQELIKVEGCKVTIAVMAARI